MSVLCLLCERPGLLRQRNDAGGCRLGIGAGRIAVERAFLDALDDADEAEQIVGEEPVEIGNAVAPGGGAISMPPMARRGGTGA